MPSRLFHRRPHNVALSPSACPGDFPDPFVLTVPGGYVAYATNAGGVNVQVRRSSDLLHWESASDALPRLPGWARPGRTWSPSVLAAGGRYVLWYVVHDGSSDRQAISVATSDSPFGPFEDRTQAPTILQLEMGGSIDPSPFVDTTGEAYLLWKADANAVRQPSSLWGQRLSDDGTGLVGEPAALLRHDRSWEDPLIEAPCMVRAGDGYLLFYSAGRWNTDRYAVGFARGAHPLGPWDKQTVRSPWAASDSAAWGPGGQESFVAADGRLLLAYHGWEPGLVTYRAGGARSLRIGQLDVSGEDPTLVPLGG